MSMCMCVLCDRREEEINRRVLVVSMEKKHTRIRLHIDILPKPFLQSIFRLGLIST